MKKYELIAAFLIAFVAGLGMQAHPSFAATNLETFVSDITPNPAEPGQNILLNIMLKNSGDQSAPGVTATLKAAPPFTIKTVQNEVLGKNICAGCANTITYSLSVDSSAASGSYPVEFETSYGSGASQVVNKKAVNINVVGSPRLVLAADVSDRITPKSRFNATFEFKNIGTGRAKDIKISTASQDFVIAGGTPVLDSLSARESKKITVNFISSPNLAPNVYSIPLTLSYIDEFGISKDTESSFGISVLGNSDLAIKSVKIDPTPVYLGDEFTITARVQNIGYGDAKEVVMELDAPYSGYKKAFIGKLGKDEDAPAIFNLRADSMSSGAKIIMNYRDDFGEHQKTEEITVNVNKISNDNLYYAALVILALVAFVYRKRILKTVKE